MDNTTINLDLFSSSSTISDINFPIQWKLIQQDISESHVKTLVLEIIENIYSKAISQSQKVHISIEAFSKSVLAMAWYGPSFLDSF